MRYDPDFDTDIQDRYWSLMSTALEKKLCLRLEKHINARGFTVLLVKVFPIDRKPDCLFSAFDLDHEVQLFFKVQDFVKKYQP